MTLKKETKKVGTFMTRSVITLPKSAKVSSAARLMAERSISCIVIVDNNNRPAGIITERDIVRRVLFANIDPKTKKLGDVMSSPVITASRETGIFDAMKTMQKNKIRRIVIVDTDGKLIGLVTQTDLFKGVISLGTLIE